MDYTDDESFDYYSEDEDGGFEDDDDEDDNFDLDLETPKLTRQDSFTVLTDLTTEKEAEKIVQSVIEVLSIPSDSVAVALLIRHKWNKERLIEKYMDEGTKLVKAAGISRINKLERKTSKRKVTQCPICYDDVKGADTFALGCNHRACTDCWRTYLQMQVKDGSASLFAKCMNATCKELVNMAAYKKLLSPEHYQIYHRHLVRSYIDDNPQIKHCPAPGCEYAVRCDRKDRREAVACTCGFRFCFRCSDMDIGDHMPASCENVERWLRKASDESENVNWMLANTKKCPQCRAPIEKSGGCMHMSCTRNSGGCGFDFCWLCRGPWSDHGSHTGGYYNCNKYEKSQAKKEDQSSLEAKTELEVYMFYYHRYESHRNARKIANQQRREAESKGSDIQSKFNVRQQDTKFLSEGTEQLLANRLVLEWSYVYGYYLNDTNDQQKEKNLFEYLQEDLEKHTNHLSELYESPLETIKDYHTFYQWKEQVTNYTRVTKKFLANFVEGVSGGLT